MVSESGTGVVFPWEKQAMRGEEMPDGLDYPEQVMYQSLALLYARYHLKHISREQAQADKRNLLDEYEAYKRNWAMGEEWCEIIRLTELARAEFRKAPSVEKGWALVKIIEGRKHSG